MSTIRDLMRSFASDGRVDWIGLRPERLADIKSVDQVEAHPEGLIGDHYTSGGKRALTLIQAEHLPVIAALADTIVTPEMLRRNIVISGINLTALRHKDLTLGIARIRLTGPCAPCSRMEKTIGPGGYNAMRGHGGWYAEILDPGTIRIGDRLTPN